MVLGLGVSVLATFPFAAPAVAVATPGDTVFINELHYDNTGTDAGELVEVAGPAGTDLTGWNIVLYNGTGGAVYDTDALTGVIPDQGGGYGTVSLAYPSNGVQNGAPDGVALVNGGSVVQFLSYEGTFTGVGGAANGLLSTDIGVAEVGTEAIGLSIGLTGTGTTYGDFTWTTGLDDSPGAPNPGQTFGEGPGDVGPTIDAATPSDQSIASGATATLTVQTTAGTPPLTYQWYEGTAGDTSTPVGPDSPSFTTPALTTTTTYWVRVTNAISSADSRTALVTVLAAVSVHDIQGAGHTSPLAGQPVVGVTGIVTGVRSNGFYLQEPDADVDADTATSEGILVFTSAAPPAAAAVGNLVSVNGTVLEFRPSATNLTITEITSPAVSLLSTGNPLPSLTTIGGAAEGNLRQPPLALIDEDAVAPGEEGGTVEDPESVFDPTNDGIDFYETLEGMRAGVTDPEAVSRTTDFGASSHEIGIVPGDFAAAGTRTPRGGILYEGYDQDNPEMLVLADSPRVNGVTNLPSVDVGDGWSGEVVGIVDYAFDNPLLLLSEPLPAFVDGDLQPEVTSLVHGPDQLTIATFNLENVDGLDEQAKFDGLAQQIVTNLLSPDIVVVEEIQDNDGALTQSPTAADVTWQRVIGSIVDAGGPTYEYRQIDPSAGTDGGEPGGNIRVGFLFRTDTGVAFVDRPGGDATTPNSVVDVGGVPQLALSPGRIDPDNPAFNASRKPLVGEFTFQGETVFVVGNHWNSKGGDQPRYGRFQPPNRSSEVQRLLQAGIVEDFVDDITAIDPAANVVIAGDLNDYVFSPAVHVLTDNGYTSLVTTLPANERYGYVFDGNSQILDHILASPAAAEGAEFDTVHVNSEFYVQQSDHDPSVARFTFDATPPVVTFDVTGTECAPGVYSRNGDDHARQRARGDDHLRDQGPGSGRLRPGHDLHRPVRGLRRRHQRDQVLGHGHRRQRVDPDHEIGHRHGLHRRPCLRRLQPCGWVPGRDLGQPENGEVPDRREHGRRDRWRHRGVSP